MAKQVITLLTDDIDGAEADRTVEFGLDGVNYTIDLSEKNVGKLRKALEPYISAGSRQGRGTGALRRTSARSGVPADTSSRDENRAIRDWAKENGYPMSERGRIPAGVVEAYNAR